MKTWCYHGRNSLTGDKLFGGMTHADSMEDTARKIIRQNKLKVVVKYKDTGFEQYHLEREDGKKVNLYVSVHPENLGLASVAVPSEA